MPAKRFRTQVQKRIILHIDSTGGLRRQHQVGRPINSRRWKVTSSIPLRPTPLVSLQHRLELLTFEEGVLRVNMMMVRRIIKDERHPLTWTSLLKRLCNPLVDSFFEHCVIHVMMIIPSADVGLEDHLTVTYWRLCLKLIRSWSVASWVPV